MLVPETVYLIPHRGAYFPSQENTDVTAAKREAR